MRNSPIFFTLFCAFLTCQAYADLLSDWPDTVGSQKKSAATATEAKQFSKRQRLAKYDASFLFSKDNGQRQVNTNLRLHLFKDVVSLARVQRHYTRADNKTVWLGKIQGEPHSSVSLIATEHQLTGNIRTQGKVFQLRTQKDGSILINEFTAPQRGGTDVITPPPTAQSAMSSSDGLSGNSAFNPELADYSDGSLGFSEQADVKVLVYYTRQALEQRPELLDLIDLEFIETNQAFENSGIDASVAIAAKIEIDESPVSQDPFQHFSNKTGPFANVQALRKKYQADLVHFYPNGLLLTNLWVACGQAFYSVFPEGDTSKYYGYGATSAQCLGNLTTAHELGHNFGAGHDRYVENGGTAYSNYGYVDVENKFKTVMSYSDKCADLGEWCQTIEHFSNPEKNYISEIRGTDAPTGIAEPASAATDNAAMLNFSGLSIANFYGVSAPVFTDVSQGSADTVTLSWTETAGAIGYLLKKRLADVDNLNGPLCSYPIYGEDILTEENQYTDSDIGTGELYCYSVTALNDALLDNLSSPESTVRTGYISEGNGIQLPYIEDIIAQGPQQQFTAQINLPENTDYRLEVVEYSAEQPPVVNIVAIGDGQFSIELDDISAQDQSVTLALHAEELATGKAATQLFNFHLTGIGNQVPLITGDSELTVLQQQSDTYSFSLSDDQEIQADAVYAYSTDEALIRNKDLVISEPEPGLFTLNLSHQGLSAGSLDIIVGYTDGEHTTEHRVSLEVQRTIYNPTKAQDVTWYVEPGESLTRLLPFYDADIGETLDIQLVDQPQQGTLEWPMADKVIYTANSDFSEDSFSFQVTGEDGEPSQISRISIKLPQNNPLPTSQKVVSSGRGTLFLSHTGKLYSWGTNYSGQTGLGDEFAEQHPVWTPAQLPGSDWIDAARTNSVLLAVKADGTLWGAGDGFYSSGEKTRVLTQVGNDSDWRSVFGSHMNSSFLLTKSDGSIWAKGHNDNNQLSNRAEFGDHIGDLQLGEFQQILPLYHIKETDHTGDVGFALTQDNKLYSWGDNWRNNAGREENSGYLGKVNIPGEISQWDVNSDAGIALVDSQVYFWGWGSPVSLVGGEGEFAEPAPLGNEVWTKMVMDFYHTAGIKADGSLWTWGGGEGPFGGVEIAFLGRGENPNSDVEQVGERTDWLDIWAFPYLTFSLDDSGQLWVAGGSIYPDSYYVSLGLGETLPTVYELTPIEAIPVEETGTQDSDGDGILDYLDPDDDNDGLPDAWERYYGLNSLDASDAESDADSDGLSNIEEYNLATQPSNQDSDGDGIPDGWEVQYELDPLDATDAAQDADSDGLTNAEEYSLGTQPNNSDSDGDGMPDGWEVEYGLAPLDADDAESDTDGDGYSALQEYQKGTAPNQADAPPPSASDPAPSSNASGSSGGGSMGYIMFCLLFMSAFGKFARKRR